MPGNRLDLTHDASCVVFQGADPDDPRCPCDTDTLGRAPATAQRPDRPATADQTKRLQTLFGRAGYTRPARLAAAADVVGHSVASCSALTERENRAVCDWLQRQTTP